MSLVRCLRPVIAALVTVPALACGSSFQTVYEGDKHFEHCYRLDGDDSVSLEKKRFCWANWLEQSTRGQTRDRVEHARLRLRGLEGHEDDSPVVMKVQVIEGLGVPATGASIACPIPSTPFEAPPATVAVSQPSAPPRPAPILAVEHGSGKVTSSPKSRTATQSCWHDCGETFTTCAAACTAQKCVTRCGDSAKKCVSECLLRKSSAGCSTRERGRRWAGAGSHAGPRRSIFMDPISRSARTDLSIETVQARPTPNDGPEFRAVMSRSATSLASQAQSAVTQLPGGPVLAAAIRGVRPMSTSSPIPSGLATIPNASPTTASLTANGSSAATASAEGPGAADASSGTSIDSTIQSSQDMNLYYLQLQEQMAAENRSYTACSNVLKERHDTVKNAIGNIR